MKTYGRYHDQYKLDKSPIKKEYDGDVYKVIDRIDYFAKVYHQELRTLELEHQLLEGTGNSVSEFMNAPIDVIYGNGKFIGYIYKSYENTDMAYDSVDNSIENEQEEMHICNEFFYSKNAFFIANVVIAVLVSLLCIMWFYPLISSYCLKNNSYSANMEKVLNRNGIPAIIIGIISQIVVFAKLVKKASAWTVFSYIEILLVTIIGSFGYTLLIAFLGLLVSGLINLITTILPILILLFIILMFLRSMFKKKEKK